MQKSKFRQDFQSEEMDFGKLTHAGSLEKVAGVLPPVNVSMHQVAQDEL